MLAIIQHKALFLANLIRIWLESRFAPEMAEAIAGLRLIFLRNLKVCTSYSDTDILPAPISFDKNLGTSIGARSV